jgi:hypothetical protein
VVQFFNKESQLQGSVRNSSKSLGNKINQICIYFEKAQKPQPSERSMQISSNLSKKEISRHTILSQASEQNKAEQSPLHEKIL